MEDYEKELLLKDLCARLSYEVIVKNDKLGIEGKLLTVSDYQPACGYILTDIASGNQEYTLIEDVKPYLRPTSSMTDEERKIYKSFFSIGEYSCGGSLYGKEYEYIDSDSDDIVQCISLIDWLNEHYFDYRGLIEKGLAIEAPEGMYKTE